ncbi:hypothetical protein Bca52824_079149 [Brassica carinata]|uniref:Pentatricopeptide repeat-containing protein n=1 Tax=Brassica carinata TaxID=52824 RepID=A0A8X7PZC0_BRACI|nr:hypothetical protein Bca52824_079149 [Brassica carinata]
MIRSAKALRFVRPLLLETGTLRTSLFHSPCESSCFVCERGFSSSDRNLSYKERLRNGIVGIKKDDAVALFQTMIESRPRPTVIDFNRLFTALARTKQYDLVLDLCKQMELQGIAHNIYTLSIVINCFCRSRKLGFAFSAMGKILKLGYEPDTVTFSTLINGLCLVGRVSEAVDLVDRLVGMKVIPNLIILNTLVNGLCLKGRVSEAVALIDRMLANGCQPDAFTYGPILNRMCKSGKHFLGLRSDQKDGT